MHLFLHFRLPFLHETPAILFISSELSKNKDFSSGGKLYIYIFTERCCQHIKHESISTDVRRYQRQVRSIVAAISNLLFFFFFSLFLRHDSWFEFYISKHHSSLDVMLRHKAPGHKALLSSSVDWRTKWLAVFFNLSWHLSRKKNLPLLVKYLGKSDTEFSFSEKARPFVSLFDTSRSKGWLVAGR